MKSKTNNSRDGVFYIPVDRRRFFRSMAIASAGFTLPGYLAEALTITPEVTQGPFYPQAKNIPLDKDNDLVYLNESLTPAKGIITYVTGRVLDKNGSPIRGALVELWHADNGGEYTYSDDAPRNPRADSNFAGFGQFLTDTSGAYRFRTIKAGLYRGRTRHFHFGVTVPGGKMRSTTQLFWNEVAKDANGNVWDVTNEKDNVLGGIEDPAQRASVIRDFTAVPGRATGEQQTTWDIVMGVTPVEPAYPDTPGGSLLIAGKPAGKVNGRDRFKVNIPAYAGYSYEVYANPTMGSLGWAALPFAMKESAKVDRNIYTAKAEGPLDLYVERESLKGFYYVGFRLPGANTGTPGQSGLGQSGPRGPRRGGPFGPPSNDGNRPPPPSRR
jgi:protocatechuate 3,4-dioxygenase beta subunit